MELTSTSFEGGGDIPQRHGKRSENVSPQLSWAGTPSDARSFALSVVDRDPVARNYVHWLLCDIPAGVSSLPEDAARRAIPVGTRELSPYAGPFPPSGTHDYEFTLYALDTDRLDLADGTSLDAFIAHVEPHALATATLVGRFSRVG